MAIAVDRAVAARRAYASRHSLALHRFACVTAASTLFLIFAGGLVTSTGSGLAVPDWPLSFGQVMPEMTGGVLFEHGHRMIASLVGFLTVILAVWMKVAEPRGRVRVLAYMAVVAVILQGILGGITVLYRLPPAVSILHACLAQAFLCMVVTLAVLTGPGWTGRTLARGVTAVDDIGGRLAVATTAMIYGQLILGAVTRHTGAGLAIPDFPLSLGQVIPPLGDVLVRIHFMHRLGALAVLLLVAATVSVVLRAGGDDAWTRRPALLAAGLVCVQVSLGVFTVWSRKQPWIATSHVACGAALLATSVVLTLRLYRSARVLAPVSSAEAVAA